MSSESDNSGHYQNYDDFWEEEEAIDYNNSPPHDSTWPSDSDDEPLVFKRPRSARPDRLSALPESVIVHILSFLPILDSIRTGVLSKKWQYLWTCVPNLNFDYDLMNDNFDEYEVATSDLAYFVDFVDKTLVLCDGSVKNLVVDFPYRKQFASNASLWSRFASRNGLEKFELDFDFSERFVYEYGNEDEDIYTLPQFLYTNSKFKELRFSLCRIEPKKDVIWNSLKKLSLGYVNLSDDAIQRILAGTPVLEMLKLYSFKGITSLHLGNSCVRSLVLEEPWTDGSSEDLFPLEISAPNVRSLEISGHFRSCKLVDMKSLVEATLFDINLEDNPDDEDEEEQYSDVDLANQTKALLDSLAHVKTLKLGTWFIRRLALMHTNHVRPPLLKCECLTVDTELWESYPLGIAVLLRYFPILQTLIWTITRGLHGTHSGNTPLRRVENEFSAKRVPFSGFTLLRTVKLLNFWYYPEYRRPGFQFVKIVLKNARSLQKMIVHTGTRNACHRDPNELFKASMKLLSFPRASPLAKLLVYE